MTINNFRGEYFFLSNFYNAPVEYDGIVYQNNEAAFQSAKTIDYNQRMEFANMRANVAKSKGRALMLRPDWEKVKYDIMYQICKAKFEQNLDLKEMLLNTGNARLEEGNNHGDRIWGTVEGVGQNLLGKILERIREELE